MHISTVMLYINGSTAEWYFNYCLSAGYRPLTIRFNFSVRQFQRQDLVTTIKKVLEETGMQADLLNIEITESIAMEEHSIETLNRLSNMGIQISIDDCGYPEMYSAAWFLDSRLTDLGNDYS